MLAPTREGAHNWEGTGLLSAMTALDALTALSPAFGYPYIHPLSTFPSLLQHNTAFSKYTLTGLTGIGYYLQGTVWGDMAHGRWQHTTRIALTA